MREHRSLCPDIRPLRLPGFPDPGDTALMSLLLSSQAALMRLSLPSQATFVAFTLPLQTLLIAAKAQIGFGTIALPLDRIVKRVPGS